MPPGIRIRSHKDDLLDWDRITGIFTARLIYIYLCMYLLIYFHSDVVGTELNFLLRSGSQSIANLSIRIEAKLGGCFYYFQSLLFLVIDILSRLQRLH